MYVCIHTWVCTKEYAWVVYTQQQSPKAKEFILHMEIESDGINHDDNNGIYYNKNSAC